MENKIVAIYVCWDDWDMLKKSLENIKPVVDGVIIVGSNYSNFGEFSEIPKDLVVHVYEPALNLPASENERNKRNFGLDLAKKEGYTHFIMMDADEFYEQDHFLREKERIYKNDIAGTVARVKVYFGKPTLTAGFDVTIVPFIHKLTPSLKFQWNTRYPYAFEGVKRDIRIDPTRQMNINSGVEMSDIVMHHYSWVRIDVQKKIRNSTARNNIVNSSVLQDYVQAKEGYFCYFYGRNLESCANLFNL